jgi:carbon dioxide concentrating mechanism protein CcmN
MPLQTLRSVGVGWDYLPSQTCASGDVTIHPSAAIAPGVILQAAPNSRIVIAEGVCVGMGVILNACEGTIEIQNGATLGAGVLIVGCGTIGSRACVGAATTIFNQSIAPWQVVPAGSLIGESGRLVEESSVEKPVAEKPPVSKTVDEIKAEFHGDATPVSPDENHSIPPNSEPEWGAEPTTPVAQEPIPKTSDVAESNHGQAEEQKAESDTTVYGQVYVNRILFTIFPQGRSPNSSP